MSISEKITQVLRVLGYIEPPLPSYLQKYPIINKVYEYSVYLLALLIYLPLAWYIRFEVKTFGELSEPATVLLALTLLLGSYSAFVWRRSQILQLVTDLRQIIRSSKCFHTHKNIQGAILKGLNYA